MEGVEDLTRNSRGKSREVGVLRGRRGRDGGHQRGKGEGVALWWGWGGEPQEGMGEG